MALAINQPEVSARATSRSADRLARSRTRYTINLRLLALTAVVILVGSPLLYLWHGYRLDKNAIVLLSRADQLVADGKTMVGISYYQRYLTLKPDDTEALVSLVEAYSQAAVDPGHLARLNSLLYRTLGKLPNRTDLRLLLAENELKTGDFAAAEEQAKTLLTGSPELLPSAHKVIAISRIARAREGGAISVSEAIEDLVGAAKENPGDVRLISITAETLRKYPQHSALSGEDAAELADELIDHLVTVDPNNVDALVARYTYRKKYASTNNDVDLQTALRLDPDRVDVLILAADAAYSQHENVSEAEEFLRRALTVDPGNPNVYLVLAQVQSKSGDLSMAIDTLRSGRKAATQNRLEIGIMLADALLSASNSAEAEQLLETLDAEYSTSIAQRSTEANRRLDNQLRLLQAQVDLANNRIQPAIATLRAVLATAGSDQKSVRPPEVLQATVLLAQTMSRVNRWDLAAQYWGDLAEGSPNEHLFQRYAGEAYLRALQLPKAIAYLNRALRDQEDPSTKASIAIQLLQALMTAQLMLPVEERNWDEFTSLLDRSKMQLPLRWELVLTEADYLIQTATEVNETTPLSSGETRLTANHRLAAKLLADAESNYPDQPLFWRGLVLAYQRLGLRAEAQRALEHYGALDVKPIDRMRLETALLIGDRDYKQAIANLEEALDDNQGSEQGEIKLLKLKLLTQSGQLNDAQELAQTLIADERTALQALAQGIEVSLKLEDFQQAEEWEDALRVKAPFDSQWKMLRISRLLTRYSELRTEDKQDLSELISGVRTERPNWFPIIALAAQHAQLQGHSERALVDYRLAVELGDRSPKTIEHLVSLLYRAERFNEAEEYLRLVSADVSPSEQTDSLAISLAIKSNRLSDALDLAQQSLDRNPQDAMRHIWRANLLLLNDKPDAAEKAFKAATAQFPDDLRVWNGLFSFYVQTGHVDEAQATLGFLLDQQSLPEMSRHMFVGQGHEILGNSDAALASYQKAVELSPRESFVRLRLARLLQATDVAGARAQYEAVLQHDPTNDEARRQLATILAATGNPLEWGRIEQLLDNESESSAAALSPDKRLHAMLLAKRGISFEERLANLTKAKEMLTAQARRGTAQSNDVDTLLLAGILEQIAILKKDSITLEAAREQLRKLVERPNPTKVNLALYLEFLLRHATSSVFASSEDGRADDLRAVLVSDAELRFRELKRLVSPEDGSGDDFAMTRFGSLLLQAQGKDEDAAAKLSAYARQRGRKLDSDKDKAQFCLNVATLFAKLGRPEEAENWYRQLTSVAPQAYSLLVDSLADQGKLEEAAKVCLDASDGKPTADVAVTLARLLTSTSDGSQSLEEINAFIASSLAANNDNLDLLMAVAVLRVSQSKTDEAIALFRRALDVAPNNTLALNNLATLLGEHPEHQQEALDYVERAVAIDGPQTALLDTKGTIFLKARRYSEAIECLEEATAGVSSDPRYFFHLAAAYFASDRKELAMESLKAARQRGLERSLLTEDDRKLLSDMDRQLGTSPEVN